MLQKTVGFIMILLSSASISNIFSLTFVVQSQLVSFPGLVAKLPLHMRVVSSVSKVSDGVKADIRNGSPLKVGVSTHTHPKKLKHRRQTGIRHQAQVYWYTPSYICMVFKITLTSIRTQSRRLRGADAEIAHPRSHVQTRVLWRCHCCDRSWWHTKCWLAVCVCVNGIVCAAATRWGLTTPHLPPVAPWELWAIHHICLCSRALWHTCLPSACVSAPWACCAKGRVTRQPASPPPPLPPRRFVNGGLHHAENAAPKSLCRAVRRHRYSEQ